MLGKNIAMYRRYKGYSQRELAKKIGVSNTYISQIENDKTIPSYEMLKNIADILDTDIDTLNKNELSPHDEITQLLIKLTENEKITWTIDPVEDKIDNFILPTTIDDIVYWIYNTPEEKKLTYVNVDDEEIEINSKYVDKLINIVKSTLIDNADEYKQIRILKRLLDD